jgi:hypothetical protein
VCDLQCRGDTPGRFAEKDFSGHRFDPISDSKLTIARAHGDHTGDYEFVFSPFAHVQAGQAK